MAQTKQALATAMDKAELKSFQAPDEVREFPKGRLELIKVGAPSSGARSSSPAGAGRPPSSRW